MLGATAFGRKIGARSARRWGRLPLWQLDDLPQQLADKGRALAALRLFSQGAIDRRYRAPFALGVGAKVAVGDRVAKTDVHARTQAISIPGCSRVAINSQYHLCIAALQDSPSPRPSPRMRQGCPGKIVVQFFGVPPMLETTEDRLARPCAGYPRLHFRRQKTWMPTDQVRGLKAHGTSPAKTKNKAAIQPSRSPPAFPGQPCAFAGITQEGMGCQTSNSYHGCGGFDVPPEGGGH